jgi:hypothetical protein
MCYISVSFNMWLYRIPEDGAVPPKLSGFVLHFIILEFLTHSISCPWLLTLLVTAITVVFPICIPFMSGEFSRISL